MPSSGQEDSSKSIYHGQFGSPVHSECTITLRDAWTESSFAHQLRIDLALDDLGLPFV